jgi:hypothetical protein
VLIGALSNTIPASQRCASSGAAKTRRVSNQSQRAGYACKWHSYVNLRSVNDAPPTATVVTGNAIHVGASPASGTLAEGAVHAAHG